MRCSSDSVCSYRLNLVPMPGILHGALTAEIHGKIGLSRAAWEILDEGEFPFMCRTDISKYYRSIQIDLLQESLLMNGCDAEAVARVLAVVKFWQEFCGLHGLPIGPEASAVLGNFFLRPIDDLMATKALYVTNDTATICSSSAVTDQWAWPSRNYSMMNCGFCN